jgi:hypothetical protein
MESKAKDEDSGKKNKDEESSHPEHSSDSDEGEITAVKPQRREPADNLKRRSEWFQKRHGSGS